MREINSAGGILGKKIQTTTSDTQSNPGVAKGLTQKAVDDNVFAIFGPVFSGFIMVYIIRWGPMSLRLPGSSLI